MDPPGKVMTAPASDDDFPEMRRSQRDFENEPAQSRPPPIEPSPSRTEPADECVPPPTVPPPQEEQKTSMSPSASIEDIRIPAPPSPQPLRSEKFEPIDGDISPRNGASTRSPARIKPSGSSPPRSPPRSPKSSPRPHRKSTNSPLTASPPSHRYASSAGHLPTFKGQMMESPLDVQPLPMEQSPRSPNNRKQHAYSASAGQLPSSSYQMTGRGTGSTSQSPIHQRSVSSPIISGPLPTVKGQFMERPMDVQQIPPSSPPPPSAGAMHHSSGGSRHVASPLPRFKDQFREDEIRPMQIEPVRQSAPAAVSYNASRPPDPAPARTSSSSAAAMRSRFISEQRPSVSALTTPDSVPAAFATQDNNNHTMTEAMDETVLPEGAALELIQEGFPLGLTREMGRMRKVYPLRFWVVDNSGSMLETDCTRLVPSGAAMHPNCYTPVQCSRWDELCQSVETHAHFAGVLESHATFRLLNDPGARVGPQEITVDYIGDAPAVSDVLRKVEPGGSTPLTSHLQEIHDRIAAFADSLRSNDQRAVVILATDGIPSNSYGESPPDVLEAFTDALRSLQELPVWVVVRLCTNAPDVLNYYRSLDASLEFSFEVIDDYLNEAKEIYRHNKWLNYGRPLHLCREMGYHRRVLDLLDERPLALSELRPFFKILFGRTDFPDPETDWNAFVSHLSTMNEKQQWCPMTKKMADWIDVRKLNSVYSKGLLKSIQRSFGSRPRNDTINRG